MYSKILKLIMIGSWLEWIIKIITFNNGERMALFVAKKFFNSNKCYCCERKEWLNKLTNPEYDGQCNGIKLY